MLTFNINTFVNIGYLYNWCWKFYVNIGFLKTDVNDNTFNIGFLTNVESHK